MIKANHLIGEIGVSLDGRYYIFRPSFYALAKIGSPKELVNIYNRIGYRSFPDLLNALNILRSCLTQEVDDLSILIGEFKDSRGKLKYKQGAIPIEDVYILSEILMKNGMIGNPKSSQSEGEETDIFDPSEFVGAANVYFSIPPSDGWNMTMIEFQKSMYAKYPDTNKKDYPTAQEHEELVKASEAALIRHKDNINEH